MTGERLPHVGASLVAEVRGRRSPAEALPRLVEEVVGRHRGTVRAARPDRVLAELPSAVAAVRAAIELQQRCAEATDADPARPLPLRVGLDVGEAAGADVVGSAPPANLAARLCARARPGEALATPELVDLAGPVDGVAYAAQRPAAWPRGQGRSPAVLVRPASLGQASLGQASSERARTSAGGAPTATARRRWVWAGALVAVAAVAAAGAWAVAHPVPPANHRGGTLTVVVPEAGSPALSTIDPSTTIDSAPLTYVYDGLVAHRHAPGAAGYALVPDLAVTLPRPTDGGRTYTFTLRPGLRYADGRTVTPADLRRGIERAFTTTAGVRSGGAPRYLAGILGGQACLADPSRCDLSPGIVLGATTVTFHLDAADPDFLAELALPDAVAVPPGTPTSAVVGRPFPGTGPYRVASYDPGRALTLRRNPHFRPRSAAAQPGGYPAALTWRAESTERGLADVRAGRADLMDVSALPGGTVAGLARDLPGRVHVGVAPATHVLLLNTFHPPFNRLLARRAVAYAVDRAAIARLLGSPAPACQLAPPGHAGSSPYCPFTTRPDATGAWHGRDLARARDLVRRSGTRGAAVDVYTADGQPVRTALQLFARELREIGYRVTLHAVRAGHYPSNVPLTWEAAGLWWQPELPTAAGYEAPLLSCAGSSTYCHPAVDRLAARAGAAEAGDPARAEALWEQVYRALVDDVPLVPTNHGAVRTFVSARVGNFASSALSGPLLDQLWVR